MWDARRLTALWASRACSGIALPFLKDSKLLIAIPPKTTWAKQSFSSTPLSSRRGKAQVSYQTCPGIFRVFGVRRGRVRQLWRNFIDLVFIRILNQINKNLKLIRESVTPEIQKHSAQNKDSLFRCCHTAQCRKIIIGGSRKRIWSTNVWSLTGRADKYRQLVDPVSKEIFGLKRDSLFKKFVFQWLSDTLSYVLWRVLVTIDGVWIGNLIYLVLATRNYNQL
jgi:hypothetical protein